MNDPWSSFQQVDAVFPAHMADSADKDYLRPSWWQGPLEGAGAMTLREVLIAVQLIAVAVAFACGYWFADILEGLGL